MIESRRIRIFQMVSAVGELDRKTGEFTLAHGGVWRSGFFGSCDWRHVLHRPDLEEARAVIAEHLNGCPSFPWPLLPSLDGIDRKTLPRLKPKDVLPGSNLDTEALVHFGVTTAAFEVATEVTDADSR